MNFGQLTQAPLCHYVGTTLISFFKYSCSSYGYAGLEVSCIGYAALSNIWKCDKMLRLRLGKSRHT